VVFGSSGQDGEKSLDQSRKSCGGAVARNHYGDGHRTQSGRVR
jgi:hypothetical protein